MSKKHFVAFVLLAALVSACAAPTAEVETPVVTQPPASPYPAPQQAVNQPTATSVYPGPDDPTSSDTETQEPVEGGDSEYAPAPGDEDLTRGVVHLDLESSEILVMESFPVQVNVILRGSLPDPCHELRVVPSEPDRDNNIELEVYSLADPSVACITVIEPFEATISLGSFPQGTYTIEVNGEVLGEFDA
jgi:hypothetical protein